MRTVWCKAPVGLALFLLVVPSAMFTLAQAPKPLADIANSTSQAAPAPQASNSKQSPPPGKMRGLTNQMRWAAATRAGDRRAKAHGKHHKSANAGVQQ